MRTEISCSNSTENTSTAAVCTVCPHHCRLTDGQYGRCRARKNEKGEILPYIDAMNIDLKGFTEEYYHKLGGNLETVKNFIKRAADACHVELTTLIVPGENDSVEEMEREAEWIASVSPEIVLHVTRFFPRYRMTDRDAADEREVYRLRDASGKYLKYVYTGNC